MILLFDIDGTLILSGGAGTRAFNRVFEEFYGIPHAMDGYAPQGKTDTLIAKELYEQWLGQRPTEAEIQRILRRYVEFLREEVPRSSGYRVLPGVTKVLEKLSQAPDVLLGLATGNIEEGAKAKLSRANLFHFFEFGVYGDHVDRSVILKQARDLGRQLARERGIPTDRVIAVGDTVRDIWAARAAHVEVVIVTTGPEPPDLLAAEHPDLLIRRLDDPAFEAYLHGD